MKPNPNCEMCGGCGEIAIEQLIGGEYVDETMDCPSCEAYDELENEHVNP